MTAAELEELDKKKKAAVGLKVTGSVTTDGPKIDLATAQSKVGTEITVTPPTPRPDFKPFVANDLASFMSLQQPDQKTTTASSNSGVTNFMEARKAKQTNLLQQTINIASMNQPDREAEILRVSKEFNIAPSIVKTNLEELQRKSTLMKIDFETLQATNPILSDQLKNISFANVAHDDLEALGSIESAFKWVKEGVLEAPENASSGWDSGSAIYDLGKLGTQIRNSGGDITPDLQAQIDSLHEILQSSEGDGFINSAAQILGTMYPGTRDAATEASAFALGVAGTTFVTAEMMTGPAMFVPDPSDPIIAAGAAATGMAAFGPKMWTGMATNAFDIEGGISYLDLIEMGATHENANNISVVVGSVNAALEMVSVAVVSKPFRKAWTKFIGNKVTNQMTRGGLYKDLLAAYLLNMAVEPSTEWTQEFANIIGENFAAWQDEGVDIETLLNTPEGREKAWERMTEVFKTTAEGMALLALPGVAVTYANGSSQVAQAEQSSTFFNALADGSINSNLVGRLPETAQEFIKKVAEDGGTETVFIDHQKLNDVLNQRGIDPSSEEAKEFFQNLGIEDQLAEVSVTGGDIAIPIEKYATNIAGTDIHPSLAPHIRVKQEHWSTNESENWVKNNPDFKANFEAIEAEAARVTALNDSEREKNIVYKEVFSQLIGQGTSREDATAQSIMYSAVFEVLGKEGNVSPAELFQKYGLNINRIFPEKIETDGTVTKPLIPEAAPEIFDLINEVKSFKDWAELPENQLYLETSRRQSEARDLAIEESHVRIKKVKVIQAKIKDTYEKKLETDVANLEPNLEINENEIDAIIEEYGNEYEGFNPDLRRGYENINSFVEDYIDNVHRLKAETINANKTLTKKDKNKLLKENEKSKVLNIEKFDNKIPKAPTGDAIDQGATHSDAYIFMPQSLSHIYWPLDDASTQRTIPDTWPTETEENPFWNRLKEKVTGYMTVEGKAYFIDEIDNYSNLVVLVNNKGEETIYTYAELEKLDLKNIPKPKKAFPKNKTEKGEANTRERLSAVDRYNAIQVAKELPPIKSSGVLASELASMTGNQLRALADKLDIQYEDKATKAILIDRINANQTGQKQGPLPPKKPLQSLNKPAIRYLVDKGGILSDSEFGADLKSQDVSVKNMGLVRKPGEGKGFATTGDNIPIGEFREETGLNPPDSADNNGYVDIDWLLERLLDEDAGTAGLNDEDQAAMDAYENNLAAYEEE